MTIVLNKQGREGVMNVSEVKSALRKTLLLASLLPKQPQEFCDRVATALEVRWDSLCIRPPLYPLGWWSGVIQEMERNLHTGLVDFLQEPALTELEQTVSTRIATFPPNAPFRLVHNADFTLARLCYVVCRALKPSVVVETGVAYGVTSTFILKALAVNEQGHLHSIDFPPLSRDADGFVGILIPEPLKDRWSLYRGVSKRILPTLLQRLQQVDIFVHDSLHTYKNIQRELQVVTPYLVRPAVVLADDVDGNAAFLEWTGTTSPAFWTVLPEQEKNSLFGVSVLA
jgi:Methyltransferase domain